jgi:hypothetical protein
LTEHLDELLADADDLNDTRQRLRTGGGAQQSSLAALNRAVVVGCVSAWEAYIEALVREALTALRPVAPPLGVWPALNAAVRGQLGRFHTPSADNVRILLSDTLGLPDVQLSWVWSGCPSARAIQRLAVAMDLRHQIAHGVNPRPYVGNEYSRQLPNFFRRLGRCTDAAVRNHLVATLGIANPWPP